MHLLQTLCVSFILNLKMYLIIGWQYELSNPPILRTRGHKFSSTAAAASEDGHWLFTSSKDGSIVKWDLYSGKKTHTFFKVRPAKTDGPAKKGKAKGKAKATQLDDLHGHTDEIWALALSPDGKYLASGGKDKRVIVWDTEKDEWIKGFGGHRDSVSVRATSPLHPVMTLTP